MRAIKTALHAAEKAEDEAAAAALYDKGDRLGEVLDAIDENLLVYAPETAEALFAARVRQKIQSRHADSHNDIRTWQLTR